jgi:hypothetical protein
LRNEPMTRPHSAAATASSKVTILHRPIVGAKQPGPKARLPSSGSPAVLLAYHSPSAQAAAVVGAVSPEQ